MEGNDPTEKAQTVDPEVRAYVYSLVNALGGSSSDEDGRYVLGDDALACLRDLKRWLKLYDEKLNRLDVARCLAEAKLMTGDVLPILASWSEDGKSDKLKSRVALACLELLVPLTWPLETGGEMTINHHRHTPYLQQAQVLYKAGVMSWDTCSILRQCVRIGLPSIALPRDERTPRDEGIIKLLLYFLRNVAAIRQAPNLPSQGLEMEVSRSATIETFRNQDVFALLLTIASNMGEDFSLQDMIVLEIIFNLIRGVDVKKLWMTKTQRAGKDFSDLKTSLSAEQHMLRESKRGAPSRHSRFGTMIWVKGNDGKMSSIYGQDSLKEGRALFNIDKSKKWSKPQTKQKDTQHTMHDFNRFEDLTDSATEKLRNFVGEFLDSGFNPLFTHLRKAIEREAERLLDINYRQFFYCIAWFLEAERCRRAFNKKDTKPAKVTSDFTEVESYTLVASVLNQETFITLNKYMQNSIDNKEWQDLNASMRCFTQILLTIQDMAISPLEEDQEISENIQNRIFYEETTHDRIVGILKGYKDQGFGYLDACTELSHVFLRMLERYSKENVDLQIRSKRKARRKRKEAAKASQPPDQQADDDDNDSENEEHLDTTQVSKERKFDFNRFAAKFVSQNSINTFVSLLTYYKDLSTEQLKRCHRFFYRVAFKQDQAVLLYRVDIMSLFYKLSKGPDGLDVKSEMYRDWTEFSRQVFKKMLKKLGSRPELLVEMLFSKINSTLFYLEYGREKQTSNLTKAPAELEVKAALGRGIMEQIGIVVSVLLKDDKKKLVDWVQLTISKAYDERAGWEGEARARQGKATAEAEAAGEVLKAVDVGEPAYVTAKPTDEEVKIAMFKNARLKLLMKLCGMSILGDEDVLGAQWIIPGSMKAEQLKEVRDAIAQYENAPWQGENDEEQPEDMLRRVPQKRAYADDDGEPGEARRDNFIDDSEGEDNEDFAFPDNIKEKSNRASKRKSILEQLKKRKRKRDDGEEGEVDDEVLDERRKKRKEANDDRRRKIKSDLYVVDSDEEEDEESRREFFKKEEELRRRTEEGIRKKMVLGSTEDKENGKKSKKRKTAKLVDMLDDEGDLMIVDEPNGDSGTASSQTVRDEMSEDEDPTREEETPLSSQSDNAPSALKELPQPRAAMEEAMDKVGERMELDEEDEVDEPVSTARRRVRGGFIVDSDDDD